MSDMSFQDFSEGTSHDLKKLLQRIQANEFKSIDEVKFAIEAAIAKVEIKKEASVSKIDIAKNMAQEDATVRVKVLLLEEIMNLMGELVLSRNQLKSYTDKTEKNELSEISQNISGIISELQDKVMKTRLQPVSIVLKPLSHVVREISKKLNKKTMLAIEGQETELDRSVLDGIKDPLTHVLHNLLNNSIEPHEDRIKSAKPEEATIKLKVYHEGSMVVIEVSDDGRGLNIEEIKSKAIDKKLLPLDQIEKMNAQEICQLIFMSGFNSSDQISEVDRCGVNMDVVRSSIETLGGHVELDSNWGKGAVFKFKIPLTLAIIPALVVEANGVKYSIPQESLVEMVLIKANDVENKFEKINGITVLRLRGNLLPTVRLHDLLSLPLPEHEPEILYVIVLNVSGNPFGLIVETVHDMEEIVVKTLDYFLEDHVLFSGATILGDGSISLILDTTLISEKFKLDTRHGDSSKNNSLTSSQRPIEGAGQLLSFRLTPNQIYGVLLNSVYRLENVKSSRVESLGGKWFLQYRGKVLPLISSWQSLDIERRSLPEDVNIIVFIEQGREIGLMVGIIEDALPLTHPIVTDIVFDERYLGSSIVAQKVVTILNLKHLAKSILRPPIKDRERVLLWDDAEGSRHIHAQRLRDQGYEVNEVSNKTEAEELMEAKVIDIVVTSSTVNVDEVKAFSKDLKIGTSILSMDEIALKNLDYQETLDSAQLIEGLRDLGQSK